MTLIARIPASPPPRQPRRVHDRLGAHVTSRDGVAGVRFAVWAPNASAAAVIGSFNGWDAVAARMYVDHASGVWEAFVAGARR